MQETTSERIQAIRTKAGNPGLQCPTCTRAAGAPFRVYSENGKVHSGCIDAFHTGHLPSLSESNAWHVRAEAVALRKRTLAMLTRP
jgi:hypothetical protein